MEYFFVMYSYSGKSKTVSIVVSVVSVVIVSCQILFVDSVSKTASY